MTKKIQIHLRIKNTSESIWKITDKNISYALKNRVVEFDSFDSVFCTENNNQIYSNVVKEIIMKFKKDESATIFAYGQTGSGKTHTIFGESEDGIVKLALFDILPGNVEMSFIELFNEKIIDLSTGNELKLYQKCNQTHINNLNWKNISDFKDSIEFIDICLRNRKTGVTSFNSNSSRSHGILQIRKNNSILSFVDLAGSERACYDTKRMKEAAFINKSLLALGKLVNNLLNGRPFGFRDSKLTRILQNSITNDGHIQAFCMLNPSESCLSESLSTLNFAARLSNLNLKAVEKNIENTKDKVDFYEISPEINNELVKILKQRINDLEETILSFLKESPNKQHSEIFILEKQMFKIKLKKITDN